MRKRALLVPIGLLTASLAMSPSHAAFPGRNGRIVFTGLSHNASDPVYEPNDGQDAELWSVLPDGSRERNLTDDDAQQEAGHWSPNGRRLLFACRDRGSQTYAICLARADGSKRRRLTNLEGDELATSWSPDGDHVLFVRRAGGRSSIWKMRSDGSHRFKLLEAEGNETQGIWCPRGHRIAFVSDRGGGADLYIMRKDGTHVRHLTRTRRRQEYDPDWSPDCSHLVFTRTEGEYGLDVYKMRLRGRRITRLTNGRLGPSGPVWSPDGKKIAFADGGNYDIYVMDKDGTGIRRITSSPREDLSPNWQPR